MGGGGGGREADLKGSTVVLGADHGAQLLAVHCLLHLLEELPEGLLVIVCLELQEATAVMAMFATLAIDRTP